MARIVGRVVLPELGVEPSAGRAWAVEGGLFDGMIQRQKLESNEVADGRLDIWGLKTKPSRSSDEDAVELSTGKP